MQSATAPVRRWLAADLDDRDGVASRSELARAGLGHRAVSGHLRARRWQLLGSAIVLHNGAPTRTQRERAALISCGPRSALTSFTAVARWGLTGWDRDEIHVLVPVGTRPPAMRGVVVHRCVDWPAADIARSRDLHRLAPSLLLAATSLPSARYACAILAAGVQQRLVNAAALHTALDRWPKLRYYRSLRLALYDIEQGAHALSEIDFVALCRRHRLPLPVHQAVRVEPSGRRRFLDAEWRRRDGTVLAAEIDGAIHFAVKQWVEDTLRQNEVVLTGTPVLRYPSVVFRTEAALVASQLRRGLLL